jgi:glycosyltransferase involved in cell wall biosynthesis
MDHKKFVIIVNRFHPDSAGVGNTSLSLALSLTEEQYCVSVLTPKRDPLLTNHEKYKNIDIYRIGSPALITSSSLFVNYLFYLQFFTLAVFLILLKIKPKVILGQTAWEGGFLGGICGLLKPSIISMVHNHGNPVIADQISLTTKIAYHINKRILSTNTEFLNDISRYYRKEFQSYIAGNIFHEPVIHESKKQLREKIGLDENRFHVICVGRLIIDLGDFETKGFSYAIEAMKKMPGNIILHIFGEGPLEEDFRKTISDHNLHENVIMHGFVERDILYRYMKAADALLMTSLSEGVSMTMIEAFSQSLPMITTRTEGALEYVADGRNGLFIEKRSPDSIVEKVTLLAQDPELHARLSRACRETFEKHFSKEAVLKQYLTAIKGD